MESQKDKNAKREVIIRKLQSNMAGSLQVEGNQLAILSCQANLVTILTFKNLLHGLFSFERTEHRYFGEGSRRPALFTTLSPFKKSGTLLLQQVFKKVIVEQKGLRIKSK